MKAFFLHYEVEPAAAAESTQRGYADVCCIAETIEDAHAMATAAIAHQQFAVVTLLSYGLSTPELTSDLDKFESTLLEKALRHTPQAALQLALYTEHAVPGASEAPLPDQSKPH